MPTKTITTRTRKPKQELAIPQAQAPEIDPAVLEQALTGADLSGLKPENRIIYYMEVCKSLQLNHLTRPFLFVTIDGKTVMYATKDCTEQLRKRDCVIIKIAERKTEDGLHIVIARANTATREDESVGVEPMIEPEFVKEWNKQTQKKEWVTNPIKGKPLSPADRAKAMMKAETKAKRRVTLSIAGLGIPDESEIESIITEDITAVIEKQGEQAKQLEVATEKAADAKIIDAGGTVEKIEPAKAEVLPETPAEKKKDWRKVKCHVGRANGPWLGVLLGEMNPHALQSLHDDWLPTRGMTAKDKALATAVDDAIDSGAGVKEEVAVAQDAPQAPATPEKAETTTPEPTKSPQGAESEETGVAEPEKPKLEKKPMAWKEIVAEITGAVATNGKTLNAIATAKKGEIQIPNGTEKQKAICSGKDGRGWLRSLCLQGIPALQKADMELKDKVLVNGIRAACEETGCFDDEEWIAALNEEDLRLDIRRRLSWINVSEQTAEKELADAGLNGKAIATAPEEILRYLVTNWSTVVAALTEEK